MNKHLPLSLIFFQMPRLYNYIIFSVLKKVFKNYMVIKKLRSTYQESICY